METTMANEPEWPRVAECRWVGSVDAPRSRTTSLGFTTWTDAYGITRNRELVHRSEGYAIAGSMMRWNRQCWSLRFWDERSNAFHGEGFTTIESARQRLNQLMGNGTTKNEGIDWIDANDLSRPTILETGHMIG